MRPLISIAAIAMFLACSSTKHEVEEIDYEMEEKGQVDNKKVGLNDDGEAIIQEEVDADDELRRQEWVNNRLEDELVTEHAELKRCREELADPRLGGSGEIVDIPEIDGMKSTAAIKEQIGLNDEEELKVVRRQYFLDQLKKARKYEVSVRKMKKTVVKNREQCDRRMRIARVKAGLPANRYQSKGYFRGDGTWVETRRAELTIDDAFEIKSMDQTSTR